MFEPCYFKDKGKSAHESSDVMIRQQLTLVSVAQSD